MLKYDLEPLPSSLTPLERMERGARPLRWKPLLAVGVCQPLFLHVFFHRLRNSTCCLRGCMCISAGFSAFFEPENGAAREQDAEAQGQQMSSGQVSVFLSSSISAGQTAVDQDGNQPIPAPVCEQHLAIVLLHMLVTVTTSCQCMCQRCSYHRAAAPAMQWSACAGVTLSNTPLLPGTAEAEEVTSSVHQGLARRNNLAGVMRSLDTRCADAEATCRWQPSRHQAASA